ncbi:alpha/beta fold hydrolase [Nocardioides sp. CFH 31398]|uniref:alpha/beta fold hydrolase n=1 Tax=Nocardioides sp. CFH 31398 TaxID=2919579 RepID=UPI001F056B27|nr:alpha/beta fold hydrolase [Nocardioides sp. CFH 31398]MCH1865771.1 alpha/beta fold hydrolase [Nocardioides sp. CFH 31398]
MTTEAPDRPTTDLLLVAGLWLRADTWDATLDAVAAHPAATGVHASAVRLPGVDDEAVDVTLDDQLAAVLADVDAAARAGHRVVVVGHSAAATLAWLAADRRPDAVARVVLVGGFPSDDGAAYAAFFDVVDGVMAFPGWEPFAGPDSDDLDEATRERVAAAMVPVPGGVATGAVAYTDTARGRVPVTLVCPEFSPDEARGFVTGGDVPELAVADVTYVDLPTGHWPQVSAPGVLAGALVEAATAGR